MKTLKSILIIAISFILTNCTKVVDIPLDNAAPKIVIEALINWEKGTTGNVQKIKLKTTSNYYSNVIPTVSGATVTITNSTNTVFNFVESQAGEYVCNNFVPVLNQTYTLRISSNGKIYTSTETLKPTSPIIAVTQEAITGTNNGKTIKSNFLDPAATEDFYLFKLETPYSIKPNVYVLADEFFNGNSFFSESSEEKLKTNDLVKVTHFGISRPYFEYLEKLISVSQNSGGLFSSPPVTVRGNIINETNVAEFPFGFFALSETVSRSYIVQ
jgi:Domain of unknown function (DUF4249)